MKSSRAWIRLPSGGRLDLISPDPQAWTDSDLAIKLSRTFRWGGESKWPHPLSVAQHSLAVLELRRMTAQVRLTPEDELMELLHDAEEGFLGFDCISPLKAVLGDPFQAVSTRLTQAISARYSLPNWSGCDYPSHKCADLVVAASEAMHSVGWNLAEIRNELCITHPILECDPLAAVYGVTPWEPWAPEVAAERFLDALSAIGQRRTDGIAEAGLTNQSEPERLTA
jgi:uncharacterized protein